MACSSEKLKDKEFQNWLKVALGVSISKRGMEMYVSSVIEKFHMDALKDILSADEIDNNALCSSCDNQKLKSDSYLCPMEICHKLKGKICRSHAYFKPSWKNTRADYWCRCPWEIAKCYMPPGYRSANSASETDMNGILSIMMNHLEFDDSSKECEKAREVTKMVRHSADLSMSDQKRNDYLDDLINFLEEYKEKHNSVIKSLEALHKLKEEKLPISTDDIMDVLKANVVEDLKDKTKTALDVIDKKRNHSLQVIIKKLNKLYSTKSKCLDKIFAAKLKDIENEVSRSSDRIKKANYENLKPVLKEDLMVFNKSNYGTIPLSPLFEKEDTPFEEMYVSPNMEIVEHPFRKSRRADIKTNLTCLRDIFRSKKSNNIYVTSNAGLGKTVFCKRLIMAWCQAHNEETLTKGFETDEDLNELKKFDYAFLVPLREARTTDCDIDSMIYHLIISHLGHSSSFKKEFLQEILTMERCLIILDGLDEWTHPKLKKCKTKNDIPHRNARKHCTILTTTRNWKFCLLSLSINEIDIHVQITGLDDDGTEKLVDNAISNLTSVDLKEKKDKNFRHELQKASLSTLKHVPLILIHLICLWFKDNTIGETYCEIFSNIIGLHLQRAKTRLNLDECSVSKKKKMILPQCISKNMHCYLSSELLISLAELAFDRYFDKGRENTLVFDIDIARQFLQQDLEICMASGLLTQTKTKDLTESKIPRVSFTHKTFQEFFAALHLYIVENIEIKLRTVKSICNTVDNILAVTHFFIFLNGMCHCKAKLLFSAFTRVIRNSDTIKGYRSDMGSWNYFVGYNETIKRLQTMFVKCMIESEDNGHNSEVVNFEDLILDSDFRLEKDYANILTLMMKQNGRIVKSVKLRDVRTKDDFKHIVHLLRTKDRPRLEKIDLKCEICNESLELLLKDSEHYLKCFIIKGGLWLGKEWSHKNIRLSNRNLQFIWSMNHLEELYLRTIEMTHGQLEHLLAFVSRSSNMKHIGLGFLKCQKHNESCKYLELNLANHSKLRMLEIGSVPLSKIRVNTHMLEVCYVGSFTNTGVLFDIFDSLSCAQKLHVFCCGFLKQQEEIERMQSTLGELKKLQHSWLFNMELGNNEFRLCNDMKEVKELFLIKIQMSIETFRKLVEAVKAIDKTVIVGLFDCTVDPHEDFDWEKQSIKSTTKIHVIQDLMTDQQHNFIFKTLVD